MHLDFVVAEKRLVALLKALTVLGLCAGLLSACRPAAVPLAADIPSVESREKSLQSIDNYGFHGALGIWSDTQNLSSRIQWLQTDELTVTLTAGMGLGSGKLVQNDRGAALYRGDRLLSRGSDGGRLLQEALDLPTRIPIDELGNWVRGLPGNANSVLRDDQGKLSSLRYRDEQGVTWRVRILRYEFVGDFTLPSLITASGGPYSLRVVLKDWQLDPIAVVPETVESNNRLAIPGR